MRDERRIPRIADLFEEVWRKHPDWRMGQTLSNLRGLGPQDVFYWSDAELERALLRNLGRDESESGGEYVRTTPDPSFSHGSEEK